jgi:hypothetical protein
MIRMANKTLMHLLCRMYLLYSVIPSSGGGQLQVAVSIDSGQTPRLQAK